MKILFVNHELPPIGGGGGRANWQIARRLAHRGHQVMIMTSLFHGLAEHEISEDVQIRRIPVKRHMADRCPTGELLSFIYGSIRAIVPLADTFSPDVTCAFFGIPGGPAAWWLKNRRKIPYVISLRGSDVPRRELAGHQRLHLVTRPVLQRIWHDAAGLAAVSGPLRRAVLALAPRLAIDVIPNGVDIDLLRPHDEKSLPQERRELLYVGRLREFKGVQYLLQALPEIEASLGRPVRLTVVGDGPYRRELEGLAAHFRHSGTASGVRFTGWLDQNELNALYAASAVLVLPSLAEGHPNVLLEAMASGLPCVASNAPGTREMIVDGQEGFLVDPTDPHAIAIAIVRVLSEAKSWIEMSRCARARAEKFSWDDVAERYETLLLMVGGKAQT